MQNIETICTSARTYPAIIMTHICCVYISRHTISTYRICTFHVSFSKHISCYIQNTVIVHTIANTYFDIYKTCYYCIYFSKHLSSYILDTHRLFLFLQAPVMLNTFHKPIMSTSTYNYFPYI